MTATSTIGLNDLVHAVWNNIQSINPGPAFRNASWGIADNLAPELDYFLAATAHAPTIELNTSAECRAVYSGPSGSVILSIYGSGIDKLFGGSDAIGTVNVTRVNFSYPTSGFVLDLQASGSGFLIDFSAGIYNGLDLFSGNFHSFSLITHDLSITATGEIALLRDPDTGETGINGTLSDLTITYRTAPDHYTLSLAGVIHYNMSASGTLSLSGSSLNSFSISEAGNHFNYTGDFTYYGNLKDGYVTGSLHEISVVLAGFSFDIKGNIHLDASERLSGTITDLDIHAVGSGYDARYTFAGKNVNVLDLFDEHGKMKDIDGDGNVDEHDLYQFLVNVDDAVLTGLNMSPDANNDVRNTDNSTALHVDAVHGVLANDTDPEGDSLYVSKVWGWDGGVNSAQTLYAYSPVYPYYALGTITIHTDGSYDFVPGTGASALSAGQTVTYSITYSVSDGYGNNADATLSIHMTGANHAPTVWHFIADQNAMEDSLFTFIVPSDTFADVDGGDTLTWSATLADGSALPDGLSFDATTHTFSGTPTNDNIGTLDVRVTVTDSAHASTSDDFTITVFNTNDPPTVANPIADQSATEDSDFSYTVPSNSFADVDTGDTLTYSATLSDGSALPGWLAFNTGTRTFSGTPLNANVGSIDVKVTATDSGSAAASDVFRITVANTNDAPTVANPIADQNATEGSAFSYTVPSNSFADVDTGDTLTYSATLSDGSALPGWLAFNAGTRTFSGTPLNENVGSIDVKVTATDSGSATASDVFRITISNTNNAPTLTHLIADQNATEDSVFSFTVPSNTFTDVDTGDTLTWSATLSDGSALPSWLSFNSTTHTFSGTPANDDVGVVTVQVTASDSINASASDLFALTVANVNDAPVVAGPLVHDPVTEGDPSFAIGLLTGATDVEGDALSVGSVTYKIDGTLTGHAGRDVPGGLSLSLASKTLTVNPGSTAFDSLAEGQTRTIEVSYIISDGHGGTVPQTATISVTGVNDAPTSSDDSITMADNAEKILALTNFGVYHDAEGDALSSVTITSVPAVGTLEFSSDGSVWSAITSTTDILASDISAGHLKYVPVVGMTSTTMGFHVTGGGLTSPDYLLTVYAEHIETLTEGEHTIGGSTVIIPEGVTVDNSSLGIGLALDQLYAFVDSNDESGVIANQALIHQQIDQYIEDHPDAPQVHELTLNGAVPGDIISIDGGGAGDGVMVIDASSLPHGTVIDLNNIGFAVIIGPGYYSGGAGSNIIVADGGSQFIILGADDDTTHGGAGDDTIGSTAGNDDLYGDEDNDVVFGGLGDDTLHGGTGNDTVAGGSVTVHADGTHTVTDDVGHDVIDGGEGTDIVEFSGTYADYFYSYDKGTGSWTVQDAIHVSAEGDGNVDTITGTEVFSFTDGNHNAVAHDCTVDVNHWKSGAGITGVLSTMTDTGNDQQTAATDTGGGEYGYSGLIEGSYTLESSRSVVAVTDNPAVKINDALAALKIAYGINPNGTAPVSNYQFLASDINKNGLVQISDALNILKLAYNLPATSSKEWVIVDDSVGSQVMNRNSVDWSGVAVNVTLDQDQGVHLIGVLTGDVDGSWVA
jgi:hypothetical protein